MVTRSQLSTTPKASLGSIVGACLHRPDGELLVDGLATEIITLAGSFLPGANGSVQASTSAVVVDRHDQVYAGPLIRGHDPAPSPSNYSSSRRMRAIVTRPYRTL